MRDHPKLSALESAIPKIDDKTRTAVLRVLENNWPFIMLAKRPDGQWEQSAFYGEKVFCNAYEIAGVLHQAQNDTIWPDSEEDND